MTLIKPALVLSLLLWPLFLNAQVLPRIGDTIDVAERNYFELFPQTKDFKHAIIYGNARGDSNYIVLSYGTSAQERLYFFNAKGHAQFSEYLTHFEELALGLKKSETNEIAGIISGFSEKHPRGTNVKVEKTDGTAESGRVYNIDSSQLVLTRGNDPLNWQDSSSYSVIPAGDISQIRNIGRSALKNVSLGIVSGAAIGGGLGLIGGDIEYISAEQVALFYGGVLGFVGGLAGFVHSRFNPPKRFVINGSPETFAHAASWLGKKASSQHLPPELKNFSR